MAATSEIVSLCPPPSQKVVASLLHHALNVALSVGESGVVQRIVEILNTLMSGMYNSLKGRAVNETGVYVWLVCELCAYVVSYDLSCRS